MRFARLAAAALGLLMLSSCGTNTRSWTIGEGYAKTSVNATVFRGASVTSDSKYQFASYYDGEGRVVIARRKLPKGTWETLPSELHGKVEDAHNSISIALDGKGYLHISWSQHSSPMHYARSASPYEADFVVQEKMVDASQEQDVTYPEFHRFSDGSLLFAYRDGISGNGNLVLNRYSPEDGAWTRVHDNIISGEGQRNAYWQMYMDSSDAIHLSWVWRETWDVSTNHDLCYAVSRDGGISWCRIDGSVQELPITMSTAGVAWEIPQRSELINQTSMTADPEGHPFIATYWRAQGDSIPQYRMVYHDGSNWNCSQIGSRTTPFSLSGGGTKAIPISRPQIAATKHGAVLIFRDEERDSRVSIARSTDFRTWDVSDLTTFSVGSWEPSFDYERLRRDGTLDIFVQPMLQGDGEKTMESAPQPVSIVEIRQ